MWIIFAIVSAVLFGITHFLIRLFPSLSAATYMMIQMGVASVLLVPFANFSGVGSSIWVILATGVLVAAASSLNIHAVKTAPNPGIPLTIAGLTPLVMYLLSFVFLGLKLSIRQIIGALLVILGIALVAI